MATTREIRTCRVEDWLGNVYQFEGTNGSGNSGGTIISPDDNKNISTDGTIIEDINSSGSAIIISSGTENKNLANVFISDLSFDDYSIAIRMKSSNVTNKNPIIQINTYYTKTKDEDDILLSTMTLPATIFKTSNEYQSILLLSKFYGEVDVNMRLKIQIIVLPNTNATVCFDHLSINRATGFGLNASIEQINHITEVTLLENRWDGTEAPFSQSVDVPNSSEGLSPTLTNVLKKTATLAEQKAYTKAYSIIASGSAELTNGTATFYVYKKPVTNITVGLKGV